MIGPSKSFVVVIIGLLIIVSIIALIFTTISTNVPSPRVNKIDKLVDRYQELELREFGRDIDSAAVTDALKSTPHVKQESTTKTKRFLMAYFNKPRQKGIMIYNRYKRNTCYEIVPNMKVASFDTFESNVLFFDDHKCKGHIMNITGLQNDLTERQHPQGNWNGRIKSFKTVDNLNLFVIDFFSHRFFDGNRTRLYLTKGFCHNLTENTFITDSIDGKLADSDQVTTTEVVPDGSVPIPVTMEAINTHNNCIYAFDTLNCDGNFTIIAPNTPTHHELRLIDYPNDGDGHELGGWANRTLSVKSCNGDHNDQIKPDEDYKEEY